MRNPWRIRTEWLHASPNQNINDFYAVSKHHLLPQRKDTICGKSIGAPIYWSIYARCDNRRREPNLCDINLQILFRGFFFLFGANYHTSFFGSGWFDAPLVLPRYKKDEPFPCTSLLTRKSSVNLAVLGGNGNGLFKWRQQNLKINLPRSPMPQTDNKEQPSYRSIFLLYTIFNRTLSYFPYIRIFTLYTIFNRT